MSSPQKSPTGGVVCPPVPVILAQPGPLPFSLYPPLVYELCMRSQSLGLSWNPPFSCHNCLSQSALPTRAAAGSLEETQSEGVLQEGIRVPCVPIVLADLAVDLKAAATRLSKDKMSFISAHKQWSA